MGEVAAAEKAYEAFLRDELDQELNEDLDLSERKAIPLGSFLSLSLRYASLSSASLTKL